MSIIVAVLVFGLIVLIHEFGHFIVAKKCGIGVIEFSIGMGPRVWSFEKEDKEENERMIDFALKATGIEEIQDKKVVNCNNLS